MKKLDRKEKTLDATKPKKGEFSVGSDGLCPVLPKGVIVAVKLLGDRRW